MNTKYNEIVGIVSTIEAMKGKFTAEKVLRTWFEDFVDEDTGEAVSIERSELILDKGTLLDGEALSRLNFYLESGDIKEVKVSNQERVGQIIERRPEVWQIGIFMDRKINIYLYAKGLKSAIEIVTDFVELNYEGPYSVVETKKVGSFSLILIPNGKDEENKIDFKFYKVDVEIQRTEDEDDVYEQVFILKCKDADDSKDVIFDFVTKQRLKANELPPYRLTLLSAKHLRCDDIIDYEFSKTHFEEEN